MITGDHPATAAAIGAEMGLAAPGEEALTGAAIDALTDDALIPIAALRSVFARVAPEHKLRLVRALQAGGQVAAMTGDGVNDAPALEQADIGVAMGITGTAAAKDAADVVLLDDDFATIRAAVEEGRRVYDNLVKALAFTLPTNAAQAMIVLVAVLFFPIVGGEPLMPILPVQILWVNLVTSVALSLPLAFEAPEPDVMARPPRPPDEPILNPFVLRRTMAVGAYMTAGTVGVFLSEYFAAVHLHVPGALALRESQTMCVTTLALFQAFYLIDCRSLRAPLRAKGLGSNPLVFAGIAALLALQIAFVHAGVMHTLFDSAPIAALDWLECVAVAATVLPAVGAARWWARRRARRAGAA
jgi:magnesium-transporting ATPase (P-type)